VRTAQINLYLGDWQNTDTCRHLRAVARCSPERDDRAVSWARYFHTPPDGRTYAQVTGQQSEMDTVPARFRAAVQVTPRADGVYALPAVDEQVHAGSGSSAPGGQDSRPTECVHPRSTPRSNAPWLEMARPRPSC